MNKYIGTKLIEAEKAMDTSIEQFATAMKEYIPGWAGGTSAKIKKNLDAPDESA